LSPAAPRIGVCCESPSSGNRLRGASANSVPHPIPKENRIMSKGLESKKAAKKKPLKTAAEKRSDKRAKKSGTTTTLLGTHIKA
jgi:hypothetical protein